MGASVESPTSLASAITGRLSLGRETDAASPTAGHAFTTSVATAEASFIWGRSLAGIRSRV